jgi:hypothetical protein
LNYDVLIRRGQFKSESIQLLQDPIFFVFSPSLLIWISVENSPGSMVTAHILSTIMMGGNPSFHLVGSAGQNVFPLFHPKAETLFFFPFIQKVIPFKRESIKRKM